MGHQDDDHGNWNLIESEPAVFTDLIKSFGCQGIEVTEVWDLNELAQNTNPTDIYGFIFLFKYDPVSYDLQHGSGANVLEWDSIPDIYFAKQVIQNACATQAILSILLNMPGAVEIGDELSQFKSFTSSFDPELKGISITNAETIRVAHNSFARAEPFANETNTSSNDNEDLFHFVAYIPSPIGILELDGIQPGPVHVSDLPSTSNSKSWVSEFVPVIRKRMDMFANTEIRFSLLAVQQSKHDLLQSQMSLIESRMRDLSISTAERSQLQLEMQNIRSLLQVEKDKFDLYRRQNERRRHNYIPLILELLNQMASKEVLVPALKSAKQKVAQKPSS